MNVLVTGANGFIGKALCAGLVDKGWSIRGVIRSGKHVAMLPAGIDIVQIESIGPNTDWSQALENIETVVHLAARVHVLEETAADPLSEFRHVNTAGTEHLARAAAKAGVSRLLYVSTIKVNGERTVGAPFTEDDEPAPEDPYAISKWEAEQALQRISSESRLEIVIVRPPLVYGPGVKGNFLRLLKLVDRGIPLPFNMVSNRRSLIALDNLVDLLVRCIQSPQAVRQTFLAADGEDLSTPELIRSIAKTLGRPNRLFPFPPILLRLGAKLLGMEDVSNRLFGSLVINSSKVKKLLNWRPPVSVQDGLQQTARWYLSNQ
jgi:nucleoside-diphosphate-sugar epimerase